MAPQLFPEDVISAIPQPTPSFQIIISSTSSATPTSEAAESDSGATDGGEKNKQAFYAFSAIVIFMILYVSFRWHRKKRLEASILRQKPMRVTGRTAGGGMWIPGPGGPVGGPDAPQGYHYGQPGPGGVVYEMHTHPGMYGAGDPSRPPPPEADLPSYQEAVVTGTRVMGGPANTTASTTVASPVSSARPVTSPSGLTPSSPARSTPAPAQITTQSANGVPSEPPPVYTVLRD